MREDHIEKLEEMFQNGFIIVYPNEKETSIRMMFVADKDTEACGELLRAVAAIKEKLITKTPAQ